MLVLFLKASHFFFLQLCCRSSPIPLISPPLQALAPLTQNITVVLPHSISPSALPGPCSFQQHQIITAFPFSLLISPSTLSPFCYSVSLLLPLPGPGPNSPVARRQAGSEQERQQQLPHVSASLETRDGGMVEEFSGGEKPFRHVCSAKRKRQTPTPH